MHAVFLAMSIVEECKAILLKPDEFLHGLKRVPMNGPNVAIMHPPLNTKPTSNVKTKRSGLPPATGLLPVKKKASRKVRPMNGD